MYTIQLILNLKSFVRGGSIRDVLTEHAALPRIFGINHESVVWGGSKRMYCPNTVLCQGFEALWKIFFLQRIVYSGEGDHFPAVLMRTFKYCDEPRGKSWLDDVFLKTL